MTRRAHLRLLLIYTIAWEPVRVFCNGLLNAALRAAIGRKMAGFRMSHAGQPPFRSVSVNSRTRSWAAFWAAGLPSYYQQYSRTFMIWLDAIVLIPLSVVFLLVLRRAPQTRRIGLSLWMAFYFTVPLAVYDWLYCGVFLGHGLGFLWRYWYLSVYYVIPWPLLPGLAAVLNHRGAPQDGSRLDARRPAVARGSRGAEREQ